MMFNSRLFIAFIGAASFVAALPPLQKRAIAVGKVHQGIMAPTNFGETTGCGNQSSDVLDHLDTGLFAGIYRGREYCEEYIAITYKGATTYAKLIETTNVNPDNIIVSNGVYRALQQKSEVGQISGVQWTRCGSLSKSECLKALKKGTTSDDPIVDENEEDDSDDE